MNTWVLLTLLALALCVWFHLQLKGLAVEVQELAQHQQALSSEVDLLMQSLAAYYVGDTTATQPDGDDDDDQVCTADHPFLQAAGVLDVAEGFAPDALLAALLTSTLPPAASFDAPLPSGATIEELDAPLPEVVDTPEKEGAAAGGAPVFAAGPLLPSDAEAAAPPPPPARRASTRRSAEGTPARARSSGSLLHKAPQQNHS
jgi:hypothetical protein